MLLSITEPQGGNDAAHAPHAFSVLLRFLMIVSVDSFLG